MPVPRFLQLYRKGNLEDSRSFNRDPPDLTFNHGFLVMAKILKQSWSNGQNFDHYYGQKSKFSMVKIVDLKFYHEV